jgi:hypothetical protein
MADMAACGTTNYPAGNAPVLGDLISYQNDGKYSMADFRKAGRS